MFFLIQSYFDKDKIKQEFTVTQEEVGNLLSNFQRLTFSPSVSVKKYDDSDVYKK